MLFFSIISWKLRYVFDNLFLTLLSLALNLTWLLQLVLLLHPHLYKVVVVGLCWEVSVPLLLKVSLEALALSFLTINHFNASIVELVFPLCWHAGMAFGTGSAVAHRAVDAVMGPRTIQHETINSSTSSEPLVANNPGGSDSCTVQSKSFQDVGSLFSIVIYNDFLAYIFSLIFLLKQLTFSFLPFLPLQCLNHYGSDISKCQFYLDMLQECRRSSGSVLGA